MEDLRLIKVEERESFAQLLSGIVLIVVGGSMLLAGVFAAAKVSSAIPIDSFNGTYANISDNTTYINNPANVTFHTITDNWFDALELVGVVLVIVGVVLLVQGVRSMGS